MIEYIEEIAEAAKATIVTGVSWQDQIGVAAGTLWLESKLGAVRDRQNKVMVIGNGGSAAIAAHVSVDLVKNACVAATALNDPAMLTCLANDYSFDEAYAKQVERVGRAGDVLVAISSSGASRNILNAVMAARAEGVEVMTLSGFNSSNPLRGMGKLNLYVPSKRYGVVEIAHQIFLHAVTDRLSGWKKAEAAE